VGISRRPTPHVIDPDRVEWSIAEIDAAISLVASGLATSVRLCELPEIEAAIAWAVAHAQEAGVPLRFVRAPGTHPLIVVGPVSGGRSLDAVPS
jgi:hypothetical protein